MKKGYLLLVLTTLVCLCKSEEEEKAKTARLLVEKRILTNYLVENKEIEIKYSIYNVGGNSAQNILIDDKTLSPSQFLQLNNTDSIKIKELQPNAKTVQTLIFKPKLGVYGRVNFTSAQVYYQSNDLKETLHSKSSEPGIGYILSTEEYERRFSLHLIEWGIFAMLCLPSLFIPFSLWQSSKRKYESIKKAK